MYIVILPSAKTENLKI